MCGGQETGVETTKLTKPGHKLMWAGHPAVLLHWMMSHEARHATYTGIMIWSIAVLHMQQDHNTTSTTSGPATAYQPQRTERLPHL